MEQPATTGVDVRITARIWARGVQGRLFIFRVKNATRFAALREFSFYCRRAQFGAWELAQVGAHRAVEVTGRRVVALARMTDYEARETAADAACRVY